MIARVRIAPVERWCDFHKKHLSVAQRKAILHMLVGMEIEIFTDSMRESVSEGCLGRIWSAPQSTYDKLVAKGCDPHGDGMCEHMLELD